MLVSFPRKIKSRFKNNVIYGVKKILGTFTTAKADRSFHVIRTQELVCKQLREFLTKLYMLQALITIKLFKRTGKKTKSVTIKSSP